MGRGGKSGRGKRGSSTARSGGRDAPATGTENTGNTITNTKQQTGNRDLDNWKDIKYSNPAFEAYYQAQELMGMEEWEEFKGALKRDLPTTFRVTGSRA
ncbi:hypothetical protein QFC22_006045 [Naganishia vaughanmartiniae]|uniref:Uncharacterized protein n=1 Tax=Naganishia vaughanmartiniae TaxID=1424756 RepID=A0ACC2WQ30_9TREE|nr:hypothetical protein QFC22_006045 [Naganishia vaughanmartiniae]